MHQPMTAELVSRRPRPDEAVQELRRSWRHALAAALILVGAGSFGAPSSAHEFTIGPITVVHPWARATPPGAKVGSGYMTIHNRGDALDRLVSAAMPGAGRVEFHATETTGGIARMRRLAAGIALAPGQTMTLAPGGIHVMFVDLAAPLRRGEKVFTVLTFEKAGALDVEFVIDAIGASASDDSHPAPRP
jgi:copper(I)-binding protein